MSSKKPETRTRILNATWKLLETDTTHNVRMSDIAKQAKVSRQALYLHFNKRSELLIATMKYIDDIKGVDARLMPSRTAKTGLQRLDFFIEAWANYIPEIYQIAKSLLAMKENDLDASLAWTDRMKAMRQGCEAAINALDKDAALSSEYNIEEATDILWTMLSIHNWEQLTVECGWTSNKYVEVMKNIAHQTLLAD